MPYTQVLASLGIVPTDAPAHLLTIARVQTDAGVYLVEMMAGPEGIRVRQAIPGAGPGGCAVKKVVIGAVVAAALLLPGVYALFALMSVITLSAGGASQSACYSPIGDHPRAARCACP